jgi:hypothetical protein
MIATIIHTLVGCRRVGFVSAIVRLLREHVDSFRVDEIDRLREVIELKSPLDVFLLWNLLESVLQLARFDQIRHNGGTSNTPEFLCKGAVENGGCRKRVSCATSQPQTFAMKSPSSLCIVLLAVWPLAIAFSAPPNAGPERPYLVIEETTSPNARYAVAWTLPKGPQIDWEKFRSGERGSDSLPDLDNPQSNIEVEDNLIKLRSGRKLATVAAGYWALPKGDTTSGRTFQSAEEFMEVAWSAQSAFVLVLHRQRSGPAWGSLRAVQLADGAVVSQLESGDGLEAAVRSHLKKHYRQEYERGKDHLNLRISDVKSVGGSKFSLKAVANLENKDGNRSYRGSVINFELRAGKSAKLSLHVLSFTKIDLEEAP